MDGAGLTESVVEEETKARGTALPLPPTPDTPGTSFPVSFSGNVTARSLVINVALPLLK